MHFQKVVKNYLVFSKNYLVFSKHYVMPPYKKIQTLVSAFIQTLIFGKNRDP